MSVTTHRESGWSVNWRLAEPNADCWQRGWRRYLPGSQLLSSINQEWPRRADRCIPSHLGGAPPRLLRLQKAGRLAVHPVPPRPSNSVDMTERGRSVALPSGCTQTSDMLSVLHTPPVVNPRGAVSWTRAKRRRSRSTASYPALKTRARREPASDREEGAARRVTADSARRPPVGGPALRLGRAAPGTTGLAGQRKSQGPVALYPDRLQLWPLRRLEVAGPRPRIHGSWRSSRARKAAPAGLRARIVASLRRNLDLLCKLKLADV
jgi:hypothetical protein